MKKFYSFSFHIPHRPLLSFVPSITLTKFFTFNILSSRFFQVFPNIHNSSFFPFLSSSRLPLSDPAPLRSCCQVLVETFCEIPPSNRNPSVQSPLQIFFSSFFSDKFVYICSHGSQASRVKSSSALTLTLSVLLNVLFRASLNVTLHTTIRFPELPPLKPTTVLVLHAYPTMSLLTSI